MVYEAQRDLEDRLKITVTRPSMTQLARFGRTCRGAVAGAALSFLGTAQAVAQVPLDETLSALEQWVDTERRIAQERAEWETERESTRDLIALYREELEMLNSQIEESQQ